MMEESFEPATIADLEAVVGLMRRYYAEEGYPFADGAAREALAQLVRDERLGRLWVARARGSVMGYLAVTLGFSLEYGGRDAFLDELFVAEEFRGRGLGRRAVETAEEYCRRAGVRALHLEVEPHRQAAFELYRRAGFEDHARRLMTKPIRPEGVPPQPE